MDPVAANEAERILVKLGVPISDETLATIDAVSPADLWRYGDRVIDGSVADRIWREWHPGDHRCEQESFRRAFRRLLVDAYAMGLRLDSFREMSARLPDPGRTNEWIEGFEACVARDDVGIVRLAVSPEQFNALQATNRRSDGRESWEASLERVSDEMFDNLGLIYAPPRVESDPSLETPWFRCDWNDLPLPPRRGLSEHQVLVNDTVDRLALLNIKGDETVHPVTSQPSAVIDAAFAGIAEQAGLTTYTWLEYFSLCVSGAIRNAAGAFVNRRLYDLYSLRLAEFSPELLKCLEIRFAESFVVQVLRALLSEGIAVRNLSEVFRAMLEPRTVTNVDSSKYIVFAPPTGGVAANGAAATPARMTPGHYADFVRTALKRQTSQLYSRGSTLIVYLLDQAAEQRFSRGLTPAERLAFMKAVREELGGVPVTALAPVVLTTIEIRRAVWQLTFPEFPRLAVLGYQELSPALNIQPIARISPDF